MTDVDRRQDAEAEYADHLKRSRTVWDRWSDWYSMSESDFEPAREALVDDLGLEPGDTVLDVGCGPGVNFEPIREAVGEDGRIVAVDYSPEMVEKAQLRVQRHGWENVAVHRADATTADLGGPYDAAVATLALSVMPDVERAVRNIHSVLEVGGSLAVLDLQAFQSGPARVFNPLLRWFLGWYANWNPDGDVRAAVESVFGAYELRDEFMAGTAYALTATRTES
jgi:ubiquinone/menaquinone biosynthesis C-methylase UbiE